MTRSLVILSQLPLCAAGQIADSLARRPRARQQRDGGRDGGEPAERDTLADAIPYEPAKQHERHERRDADERDPPDYSNVPDAERAKQPSPRQALRDERRH